MKKLFFKKGITLVDVLVGIFIFCLFFFGIFGAYKLTLKILFQSKARVIATSLANQKIEQIRNLPYNKIGIEGGYPAGEIPPSENTTLNGVNFTISTIVDFIADERDGIAQPEDSCPNDYKRATVTVSWQGKYPGQVSLSTDIAPKDEIQECEISGGILQVQVFDSQGELIEGANVEVEDVFSELEKNCITSLSEKCYIVLPPSQPGKSENYKITVTKLGYSKDETFREGDVYEGKVVYVPEKPNATILEGEIIQKSFLIDQLSTFLVQTRSSRGKEVFLDEFEDLSKISENSNVSIENGEVKLAKSNGDYYSSGYFLSVPISPSSLKGWGELSFDFALLPDTDFTCQLLYFTGEEWELIPEEDLPGNLEGFSSSPVDLSNLDPQIYNQLKIEGNLSTLNLANTPSVFNWSLSYFTKESFPIGKVSFHLNGQKIVGLDDKGDKIFKYSKNLITQSDGSLSISDIEPDLYTFSNFTKEGENLDLVEIVPSPQPIPLLPNTTENVTLYLEAENTLLVRVLDIDTSQPIFGAQVNLSKEGYQETKLTDTKGEAFFIPLEEGNYNLSVSAEGYQDYQDPDGIYISGDVTPENNSDAQIFLTLSPQ